MVVKIVDFDGGLMTFLELSDGDDWSDWDFDYESDDEEE